MSADTTITEATDQETTVERSEKDHKTMQHHKIEIETIDRRRYLRALGAGALAIGMVGVAGCVGGGSSGGGDSGSGDETGTDGGSGASDGSQNGSSANSNADTEADAGNGGDSEATRNDASGLETYTNDEYGYSLKYPVDWEVFEGASGESESVHLEGGNSLDHVRVYVGESGGQTAKELAEEVIDQLGKDSEVISREEKGLSSGEKGQFFEYKVVSDEAGIVDQAKVLYVIADGTAYMVEAKSIAGIDEETGQRLNTIMESFTIGK